MKKLSFFLSALLLAGCGSQNISPQLLNDNQTQQIFSAPTTTITAKTGYSIALKEVKKLLPSPQLFES